jgi:predicted RNA binding protein YcfA (HicA-like mRNA interferase family)
MSGLPKVSGRDMIKILENKGYSKIRTRGSHVRLYPPNYSTEDLKRVTVPLHKELKVGTQLSIMKDAKLILEDLRT